MEILILVLLYYLSQNPDFSESVKPLMSKLKDSEQMLRFLNDLSHFTQTFSTFQTANEKSEQTKTPPKNDCGEQAKSKNDKEKTPQSPTAGIADEFIEKILESYLQKK